MNLPRTACPITYVCVREHFKRLDSQTFIFTTAAEWEELLQEAKESDPAPETVRLRAFFTVEFIYTELLPTQLFASSIEDVANELKSLRIPRTPAGMRDMAVKCEKYRKRLSARAAIDKIKNGKTQVGFVLSQPAATFGKLGEACEVVAGILRRDDLKGVTKIGECLEWSLATAQQPELEIEQTIRSLLTVNDQNPIHPWERQ